MLGEIIGELLGGVIRFIGHILLEAVYEILIKGVGYLICHQFKNKVDPDGGLVVVVGLTFWLVTGATGYVIYQQLM